MIKSLFRSRLVQKSLHKFHRFFGRFEDTKMTCRNELTFTSCQKSERWVRFLWPTQNITNFNFSRNVLTALKSCLYFRRKSVYLFLQRKIHSEKKSTFKDNFMPIGQTVFFKFFYLENQNMISKLQTQT